MPEFMKAYLVMETLNGCMTPVVVQSHEAQALASGGVTHMFIVRVLENTECLEKGDQVQLHCWGPQDVAWKTIPLYSETLVRTNNFSQGALSPGGLYFDTESAKQAKALAAQTARNNRTLEKDILRRQNIGDFEFDLVWDESLKDQNSPNGS